MFVAHVEKLAKGKAPNLEYFSVLQEYENVFGEILIFPPMRDIDFFINLMPIDASIFKNPYIMSTLELKEFQMQLEELLNKW